MPESFKHESFTKARQWLQECDGILVAAANGFSMAEGFAILKNSPWFASNFADFQKQYGFAAPIQALFYPYPDAKEFNKFYSRLIRLIHYEKPVAAVMKDLQTLTAKKPVFILTTNIEERFVQAGYPEASVFYLEGRLTHTASHQPLAKAELGSIGSLQDLEVSGYPYSEAFHKKMDDLNRFVNSHPRLLILELGVSAQNQFLRPILNQILQADPYARLIELNLISNPQNPAFQNRILQISGDLSENLHRLKDWNA